MKVPYAEFKWANFLRDKVPLTWMTPSRLADAIQGVCLLTRSTAAQELPGFKGPLMPGENLFTLESLQARLVTQCGAADEDYPSLAGIGSVESKLLNMLAGVRPGDASKMNGKVAVN